MIIPDHKLFVPENKVQLATPVIIYPKWHRVYLDDTKSIDRSMLLPGLPFGVVGKGSDPIGQYLVDTPQPTSYNQTFGSRSWVVPEGVDKISAVAIGYAGPSSINSNNGAVASSGGLSYIISYSVTPGTIFVISTGSYNPNNGFIYTGIAFNDGDPIILAALCGHQTFLQNMNNAVGDVKTSGAVGKTINNTINCAISGVGAAGYGQSAVNNNTYGGYYSTYMGGGGGVGIYGSQGYTGAATSAGIATVSGTDYYYAGIGASGGSNGGKGGVGVGGGSSYGGSYGGSPGTSYYPGSGNSVVTSGSIGGVRIIWGKVGGVDRAYPNTYTENY